MNFKVRIKEQYLDIDIVKLDDKSYKATTKQLNLVANGKDFVEAFQRIQEVIKDHYKDNPVKSKYGVIQ